MAIPCRGTIFSACWPYFPCYNLAAGRINGALDNDFKAIDKSPYSLQNYGRSQIIPGDGVYALSSCRHLGQGWCLCRSRKKSACTNTQAFANWSKVALLLGPSKQAAMMTSSETTGKFTTKGTFCAFNIHAQSWSEIFSRHRCAKGRQQVGS